MSDTSCKQQNGARITTNTFRAPHSPDSWMCGGLTAASRAERNFVSGSSRQTGAGAPFQTEAAAGAERLLQEGDARGWGVGEKTTG